MGDMRKLRDLIVVMPGCQEVVIKDVTNGYEYKGICKTIPSEFYRKQIEMIYSGVVKSDLFNVYHSNLLITVSEGEND